MQNDTSGSQESTAWMYGLYLSRYRGVGVLALENGGKANCRFDAVQLINGSVLLLCDLEPPYSNSLQVTAIDFEGRTDDSHEIVVSGNLIMTKYSEIHRSDRDSAYAAFRAQRMSVLIDPNRPTREVRFGITNFIFLGTTAVREVHELGTSAYRTLPVQLKSQDTEIKVTIRPVKHFNKVTDQLRTLKGVDVTCEAVVKVDTEGEVDRVTNAITDLCCVLSIARGTKVQWVYRDHYSEAAELSKRLHASRVTKQYGSLQVIVPGFQGMETKAFVESAYSFYVERRDTYRLHLGTIDTYLDAKAEDDYLEVRGIKIAASMEVLKNAFLGQADCGIGEHIMSQSGFAKIRKPLKKAVDTVLTGAGVDPKPRGLVYSKLSELNRTPVAHILRRLCEYVGLQASDEEVKLVVACRDRLVHMGAFYCNTARPDERKKVEPLPSGVHEFFFLVTFMDRLFLKLLGYSGPHIDWRLPGNPVRREMV